LTSSLVNPDVGDLALEDTGLEVVRTSLADEVAQRLHVRLKFFRGEWFLNLNEGVPWYQLIFVKAPQDRVIRFVFGEVIRGTEGVAELVTLDYSISSTRQLSLSFTARLQDGTLLRSFDYAPFVLAV
jgi:hypothetical protein